MSQKREKEKRAALLQPSAKRVADIAEALPSADLNPATIVEPTTEPSKKVGRPPGKRTNSDYQSVTTFLHKQTYLDVQRALVGGDQDFGDVVDRLLKEWLRQSV